MVADIEELEEMDASELHAEGSMPTSFSRSQMERSKSLREDSV